MLLFDEASSKFIKHTILDCEKVQRIPELFPPQLVDKTTFNKCLGYNNYILIQLMMPLTHRVNIGVDLIGY